MRVLFLSFFVVIADQLTKFLVKGLKVEWLGINLAGMPYASSKQVLGKFLRITFIENPGMAFGIIVSPKILLPAVTLAASIIIVYYLYRHRNDNFLMRLSLALIFAGALGNLIDRSFYGLIYGYAPFFQGMVVDFIQVEFWDFTIFGKTFTTWPILNIADLSVTCGFIIVLVFHKRILSTPEAAQVIPPASAEIDEPDSDNLNEETRLRIRDVINHISPNHN